MARSFNSRIYETTIKEWIPDINSDDLRWLCNKASDLYKELDAAAGCVDNFRVSRIVDNQYSDAYDAAVANGCCGFTDDRYTNPLTNNTFIIGFNYGH